MTNRRSFLGAIAALVTAPFVVVAKAQPSPIVTRWPKTEARLTFYDAKTGLSTPPRKLSSGALDRAVRRLRAIRRFA